MRASAVLTVVALSVIAACSESNATDPLADERASGPLDAAAAAQGRDSTTPGPVRHDTVRATPSPPPVDTLPPGNGVVTGVTFVEVAYTVQSGDSAGMRAVRLDRIGGITVRMSLRVPRDSTTSVATERLVATTVSDAAGNFTMPAQPDGIYVLDPVAPAGTSYRPLGAALLLRRGRIDSPSTTNLVLRP